MAEKKTYQRAFKKTSRNPNGNQCKQIYNFEINVCHGYLGFQLYFTEKEPDDINKILKNTKTFERHIRNNITNFALPKIKESRAFFINYKELLSNTGFLTEWNTFPTDVLEDAEQTLACMGLAMHQVVAKDFQQKFPHQEKVDVYNMVPTIRCRILNYEPVWLVKNLRITSYEKLVSVHGTIIKATNTKLLCKKLAFACGSCQGSQVVRQIDGNYTLPSRCLSKGCRAQSNFSPLCSSPFTKTINYQTIKLQELVGEIDGDNGRLPRTLECELSEDLVGCCVPGDDVTVTGILKAHDAEKLNKNKQPSVFQLYLDCVAIVNERNKSNHGSTANVSFTTKDYSAIRNIHSEPNLFRFLVQSLCPNIYGHEVVKAGLLLALFGGTATLDNIRANSHVLMVGDPGLGKSEILQACNNVSPRSVYVCGTSSTTSGLTVTMKRESGGDYGLEAGALVLADRGCLCIDEFDKMTQQHASLLEVMEQQSISIAKAGVMCSLPTRVSLLAAANPCGGHYSKAKTVAENLKMGSPLLSRFDLVFILLDKPNEKTDMLLSEHVLALHYGKKKRSSSTQSSVTDFSLTSSTINPNLNLKDRLKLQVGETIDYLPQQLFRKYIAYAKKYVHPQLNSAAQNVLKQFYLDLRRQYHKGDCTPITTRQIESLLRLTQARAKMELREEATADDANDVVEIMRHSLVDIFTDDVGTLELTRSQNGSGISNRKMAKTFLQALQQKANSSSQSTFSLAELKQLAEVLGIGQMNLQNIIESLNLQSFILMKGGGNYQLIVRD